MDVATIVQRVIDLGLNENAPDTDLQAKALGWVNSAYKDIYNLAASYSWPRLFEISPIVITNGQGTLPYPPRRIIQVVDVDNQRVLKQTDQLYVNDIDPLGLRTGNPSRFYVNLDTEINTHPKNDTNLSVVAIRRPEDLTLDSTEDDIKIPPHRHEVLIWAALVEGAVYERGFGNDALVSFASGKKKELNDDYIRELRDSTPRQPQRVKTVDF